MSTIKLSGRSLAGDQTGDTGRVFRPLNPANGNELEPVFYSASADDIDRAANLAAEAFPVVSALSGRQRAEFLRRIADELTREGDSIIERAQLETGLALPRLQNELGRTTGQLRLFAEVLEEGSWVNARIDEGDPERKPFPRPDVRSMLRALGPVAVFGASNFPLAFSVAGGDTASALAAGNPVIVKAHPAHPGTSELVGKAVQTAASESHLPPGVRSTIRRWNRGRSLARATSGSQSGCLHGLREWRAGADAASSESSRSHPLLCRDGEHESAVHSSAGDAGAECPAGQRCTNIVHHGFRPVLHQAGNGFCAPG